MIPQRSKNEVRLRIHKRIREKMTGTAERPRLNIYRSLNHVYVQLIDDMEGKTLLSASTNEGPKDGKKSEKKSKTTGGNLASAKAVGKSIAERAKQKGISKVVFDRGGYLYHGRIKALADAAREAGLQF
jgi:large subunit ribosomal protein L18